MNNPIHPSLTKRLIGLLIIGLAIISILILDRSSKVLESALMAQAKQEAHTFLQGIEAELLRLPDPMDRQTQQNIINEIHARHLDQLGFTILKVYFFAPNGEILAHSEPGTHPPKQMKPRYRALFEQGESYMGDEVEYMRDPVTGEQIAKSDIIVPMHYQGRVVAALEVEIDLQKTLNTIKAIDDQYEDEILFIVITSSLLTLFFVWWLLHRIAIIPIWNMVEVTDKISSGDLGARVSAPGKDELQQLSGSINQMADSIEGLFNEQEEAHMQMLQSLAKALEAKDQYTAGHSGRVAKFSVQLGRRIGLDEQELKLLKQGALLHDIGKIGIADAILNKPDALDDHEYEIMKRHPVMTATIMRPLKRFKEFTEIAAWHHERWDGKGYPDGLKEEDTPLLARIVGIADTWDAMTGDRVYRKGMPVAKALEILRSEQYDGQWDPELIGEFIAMIEEQEEVRHHDPHAV